MLMAYIIPIAMLKVGVGRGLSLKVIHQYQGQGTVGTLK